MHPQLAKNLSDSGRAPNHWKNRSVDHGSDEAIATEILTLLHDVYGYDGGEALKIETETGEAP